MHIKHTHHYRHYPSKVYGNPRRCASLAVDSYHRPSPSIPSEGAALGVATKSNPNHRNTHEDRDLGEQHWDHCMKYAIELWKEI